MAGNPRYWAEVEIDNGVIVEFKNRHQTRKLAFEHAVSEMQPLGERWRIFVYECKNLYIEYLVTNGEPVKVNNINEVY